MEYLPGGFGPHQFRPKYVWAATLRFGPGVPFVGSCISSPPLTTAPRKDAHLPEDPDWEDHDPGGRVERHHRQCEGEDTGQ